MAKAAIDAPPGLSDQLIERLVGDAAKLTLHFVGVPRHDMLIALGEIRDIAQENLAFLPAEVAQLTAAAFVTAIANRAAELEGQKGTLQ
jgi:hypothetical protein